MIDITKKQKADKKSKRKAILEQMIVMRISYITIRRAMLLEENSISSTIH
jgi:hypothetical protein